MQRVQRSRPQSCADLEAPVDFPPVRRFALKIGLALLCLVAAAFAAELAARRLDVWGVSHYANVEAYRDRAVALPPGGPAPDNHLFQNKPGVALDLGSFDYRTDARRLRTAEGRVAPEGAMRVLFLGDSVTLGWGVDDEETWVRRLERLARAPDGRPIECMNLGHLMYDTVQEASILRALGPELAPELVVLTFVYNDVHPTVDQLPGSGVETTQAVPPGPLGRAAERAFPTLRRLWRFRSELQRLEREDKGLFPPYSYYPSGWPRCEAGLDDVLATVRELDARLVVNDHTWPRMPEVRAWCERNGVTYVDTALSEDDQRRYRNSVIDSHLNAEGNHVVAEHALDQLVAKGVLAPR